MSVKQKKLIAIGPISKFLDISPSRIRRFEQAGLIKPTSVSESGYRYYDNETVSKLSTIVAFQQFGFTYDEIGKAFSSQEGIHEMYDILIEKRKLLDKRIRQFKDLYCIDPDELIIEKTDLSPYYYENFHWNGKCYNLYTCLDDAFHNLAKKDFSSDPMSHLAVKTSATTLDREELFKEQNIQVYIPIIHKIPIKSNVKMVGGYYCLVSPKIHRCQTEETIERISNYLSEKKMKIVGNIFILYTSIDLICTENSFCDQNFRLAMYIAPIE